MIRTKTTLVIGSGAGEELDLPGSADLLGRILQALDFARLGSELQTNDMALLAKLIEAHAKKIKTDPMDMMAAAERVRTSARIADSFESVLEQHAHDKQALAVAKLAIAQFTLLGEARSPLKRKAESDGELPMRGTENWLYQFGRLVTSGVPNGKIETCLDNLAIVNFSRDRSLQHFLPFMMTTAFGMSLKESRQLVGEKLNIAHPLGSVGRLPWEPDELPSAEWGEYDVEVMQAVIPAIDAASERMKHKEYVTGLRKAVAGSRRLVFLGFSWHPREMEFLFDGPLEKQPDVLASAYGMPEPVRLAATRMMQDRAGMRADKLGLVEMRSFELLREFSLFLQS
jgi:hypothetical protein